MTNDEKNKLAAQLLELPVTEVYAFCAGLMGASPFKAILADDKADRAALAIRTMDLFYSNMKIQIAEISEMQRKAKG